MKNRVYILGETRGAVRSQNFIKLLTDNWKEYKVYYENIFYDNRLLRYLKSLLINPFVILRSQIVYICTLNVDIDIFWELCLARLFCKRIIVDYYLSIYDTVVLDRQWFKKNSILAHLARFLDRFLLKVGTTVIFYNQTERQRYCTLAGVWPREERIRIIPLCNEINCDMDAPYLNGQHDYLAICWWGSYLPLHGLNNILEAAKIVLNLNLPVKFYFFGNNDSKGRTYADKAQSLGLSDICTFRNDYTFNNGKLAEFLRGECDVALGVFGGTEKAKNLITNKVVDSCALQTLVITGESPAVREYFDPTNSILMCEHNAEALADVIAKLFQEDKQILWQRINKTRKIYQDNFTVDCFRKKILDLLTSL